MPEDAPVAAVVPRCEGHDRDMAYDFEIGVWFCAECEGGHKKLGIALADAAPSGGGGDG